MSPPNTVYRQSNSFLIQSSKIIDIVAVGRSLEAADLGILLAHGIESRRQPSVLEHLWPLFLVWLLDPELGHQPSDTGLIQVIFDLCKLRDLKWRLRVRHERAKHTA